MRNIVEFDSKKNIVNFSSSFNDEYIALLNDEAQTIYLTHKRDNEKNGDDSYASTKPTIQPKVLGELGAYVSSETVFMIPMKSSGGYSTFYSNILFDDIKHPKPIKKNILADREYERLLELFKTYHIPTREEAEEFLGWVKFVFDVDHKLLKLESRDTSNPYYEIPIRGDIHTSKIIILADDYPDEASRETISGIYVNYDETAYDNIHEEYGNSAYYDDLDEDYEIILMLVKNKE